MGHMDLHACVHAYASVHARVRTHIVILVVGLPTTPADDYTLPMQRMQPWSPSKWVPLAVSSLMGKAGVSVVSPVPCFVPERYC